MGRPSFEEYCRRFNVEPADYPAAFAAYLRFLSDGEWDGDFEKVGDEES